MKRITLLFALLGIFSLSYAQVTLPPSGNNQKSVVTQYIGALVSVTITYNSPDVHAPNGQDRAGQIWGQLVPYGMNAQGFGLNKPAPWRAGANENTTIEFSHDVLFQGESIKAGKYGFFVVVKGEGPWEIILSHNNSAWGSFFYDPAEDALRVEATPEDNEYYEWLTFEFTDRQPEQCTAALMWENIKLPFTIEVPNMKKLYAENMRKELQNAGGFNYMALTQAANYYAQNDLDPEQALNWAEQAVSAPFLGQRNFTTLQTKATVLNKMGRTEEAAAVMDEAIKDPSATAFQIHQYGRQLIAQGQTEKALEVMQYNFDRFEGAWPTHVSMARALSAAGQYDKALEHAEKALAQAPDPLNKQNLEQSIEKLKNKQDMN